MLRTERAGRSGTNHCGIPQWTARRHFGLCEAETEHLSPPEISRRLSEGGAVIKDENTHTPQAGADHALKQSPLARFIPVPGPEKFGVRGRKPLAVVLPRLRRGHKIQSHLFSMVKKYAQPPISATKTAFTSNGKCLYFPQKQKPHPPIITPPTTIVDQ